MYRNNQFDCWASPSVQYAVQEEERAFKEAAVKGAECHIRGVDCVKAD